MAINDQVTGIFDSLIGTLSTVAVILVVAIIAVVIIGGFIWYFWFYRRQFDIIVKVFSERFGEDKEFFDKGAILRDRKENTRYLRLLKTKPRIELELPKFNIFRKTNWGDYVEIRRTSERNFQFLTPPKIDKTLYISADGKVYPFVKTKQKQIEGDITWTLNRERKNDKIIDPESILLKILQYTPQIASGVISLFMVYIIFRYAPEWLNAMGNFVAKIEEYQNPQVVSSFLPLFFVKWKKKFLS